LVTNSDNWLRGGWQLSQLFHGKQLRAVSGYKVDKSCESEAERKQRHDSMRGRNAPPPASSVQKPDRAPSRVAVRMSVPCERSKRSVALRSNHQGIYCPHDGGWDGGAGN
ncbi:uncharacterized protein V6R79_015817, partial [Siganus canaliculatus]